MFEAHRQPLISEFPHSGFGAYAIIVDSDVNVDDDVQSDSGLDRFEVAQDRIKGGAPNADYRS